MLKPVVLIIMDGWGIAPAGPGNAITSAQTPHLTRLSQLYPKTTLQASGEAVGLPKGEVGNTETGHLNLGAGRIIYQDLPRINRAIADGSFFQSKQLSQVVSHVNNYHSNLHFMGLTGAGGVHASNDHILALLQWCKQSQISRVFLHLFTDGRDSPPTSASSYISQLEQEMTRLGVGKIATLMGRYYGLDRDHRWDRTQRAYEALTEGKGADSVTAIQAIQQAYAAKITDEFIEPTIILDDSGQPLPRINDNDAVVFFNFRIDRPRQLTKAFILPQFENAEIVSSFDPFAVKYFQKHQEPLDKTHSFKRAKFLSNLFFVTMTQYEKGLPATVLFPPETVKTPIGEIFAQSNLKQLHVTETEKERFVTYYFNGQREDPFIGEDRIIVPSAQVSTYDQKPQMSASEITQTLLERMGAGNYDFVVVNLANADMVAHTGNIPATIKACEIVDECVGKIALNVIGQGGAVLITSDHGNAEEMIDPDTGGIETEHSDNVVPLIIAADKFSSQKEAMSPGILADVAPTILKLMGIPKPDSMTGKELI